MWGKDLIYFSQIGNQLLKNVLMKIYAYSMKKSTLLNAINETNFKLTKRCGNSWMCACYSLSHVWLFAAPSAVSCQVLSTEILQARILEWVAIPFSRGSSWPRDRNWSPALQVDSLPSEPLGKPIFLDKKVKYYEVVNYNCYANPIKIPTG